MTPETYLRIRKIIEDEYNTRLKDLLRQRLNGMYKQQPKVSRQRIWQMEQKLMGNCVQCGKPRSPGQQNHCDDCLVKAKDRKKRRNKNKQI